MMKSDRRHEQTLHRDPDEQFAIPEQHHAVLWF
jgi:hypothetical protein